ncbi:PREDICTED: uncharacterized protein LOC109228056 [Nicotiana attenuata]|uniref:uncharacterized protein LOC109228056 n=1 Tax=Nicotiana attenuata TaxID=49451 RepID=UPI000905B345|nr:PREDICTED: uncharacterized protein LOC109228056 [Nicotiana attenuata]
MPQLDAMNMDPYFSDHSPLCVKFGDEPQNSRPFRFFNHLAEHRDFFTNSCKGLDKKGNSTNAWNLEEIERSKGRVKETEYNSVKGYGRKGISPRCMMKLDLQKTYDSIEWVFLEQVLTTLNIPVKFVKWVMMCVSTVSYSIPINGKPAEPFQSRKGLRQGDPLSLYLFVLGETLCLCKWGIKCFKEFSRASGLKANVAKSSIYFGSVPHEVQLEILQAVGFFKRELPFKYLGIPLSTKRISMTQCQPLVDKILGRITSWTSRYLSNAGRLQLIKTVLFSIQIYWSQIFVLPKKLIKKIEVVCRTFLWTGGVETSRKALLAWEKVCMPKTDGGCNVLEISTWNKAAICKLLWNLCKKKDKLWVQWIHMYYGKRQAVWKTNPRNASWIVQKIIKAKKYF